MKFEKLLPEWMPADRPELKLRAKEAKPVENRLSGLKDLSFAYFQSTFLNCHSLHLVVSSRLITICGLSPQGTKLLPSY